MTKPNISGIAGVLRPVSFFFTTAPSASEVLVLFVSEQVFTFPANFVGSQAKGVTNPAATFALDVQKNGASVGTVSISTGGVVTMTTSGGSAVIISVGDLMKFVAPIAPDASIANWAFTFKGII